MQQKPPGKFITFEGGEGSGKSTQARRLVERLRKSGIDAVLTREPGGTEAGKAIRRILTDAEANYDLDPVCEAMLFCADRRNHLSKLVWSALDAGKWVICDRFADSTMAYQGYGHGQDRELLQKAYALIAGDFQPDLTFLCDIDPEKGLARSRSVLKATDDKVEANEHRFEDMDLSFHKRLREGFLEIADQNKSRFIVLDAEKSPDTVHEKIMEEIEKRFALANAV